MLTSGIWIICRWDDTKGLDFSRYVARREFIWHKGDKLVPAPVVLKRLATSCQKAISEGFYDKGISEVLLHQLPQYRSQFICLEVDVIIGDFCFPFLREADTGEHLVLSLHDSINGQNIKSQNCCCPGSLSWRYTWRFQVKIFRISLLWNIQVSTHQVVIYIMQEPIKVVSYWCGET